MISPIPSKEMLSKAVAGLFGAQPCEALNLLRYRKFVTITYRAKEQVQVSTLPPTHATTSYHILCLRSNTTIDWQWSWTNRLGMAVEKGHSCSYKNSSPPAPEDLLSIIRYNCKRHGIFLFHLLWWISWNYLKIIYVYVQFADSLIKLLILSTSLFEALFFPE